MGPQGTDPEVRYLAYDLTDGCRPITSFPTLNIPTYASLVDEWAGPPVFRAVFDFPGGLQLAVPIPRLPKSRRRFVKFLMSKKGMDRNTANRIADVVGWWQGRLSYAELTWNMLVAPLRHFERQVLCGDGQQPLGMVPDVDAGEGGEQ